MDKKKERKEKFKNLFGISDLDLEIIHCIFHIKKALENQMNRDVETHELSNSQIELLASTAYGDVCTSTELASKLCVSKANLTGLIARLEEKGLLKRDINEDDARSKLITVTAKGQKLVDQIVPNFIKFLSKTLENIPAKEKKSLEKNLKLIMTSIENRSLDN